MIEVIRNKFPVKAQGILLRCPFRWNFKLICPSNKSKMDFQHLSMTQCHLPMRQTVVLAQHPAAGWKLAGYSLHWNFMSHSGRASLLWQHQLYGERNPCDNCLTGRRMSLQIHGDCPPSLELWLFLTPAISGCYTKILIKRRGPFKLLWSPAPALLIKDKLTGSEMIK